MTVDLGSGRVGGGSLLSEPSGTGRAGVRGPGPPARQGPGRVEAADGANPRRLAALEVTHDPDNILRLNQNIGPQP